MVPGGGWWSATLTRSFGGELQAIHAKGLNGQVTFDGQFITIERKGFWAASSVGRGTKRIPLSSVTAVQWKPPTTFFNG
ncbi:MAG: DUF4429 domain-containing protein, partial [Actinobacteria bacterium]|nr:DUF4429 domain-containing protein [Actinomycetota bacterium]